MAALTPALAGGVPTRDELRRLIRAIEMRPAPVRPHRPAVPPAPRPLEATAPGDWKRLGGSLLVREQVFEPDFAHGRQALAPLARVDGDTLALLAGHDEVAEAQPHDLLFLDIETTGLGGAGAMVFLVTTGYVAREGFTLRQYLAGSPSDEAALLGRLVADMRATHADPVLVTYNGRAFDAPMLDGRGTMHRLRGAFEALPHLDLLHTVRRGFRGVVASCRLAHIEDVVLGVTRPADEVSGAEVPTSYFRYLRTSDARHLEPLVTHNALDVLSLAALLARLAALAATPGADLERGCPPHLAGLERLAAGRLHLARRDARALAHLEAASALLRPSIARDECLSALATLHRREGRTEAAAALWDEIAGRPGAASARALVELAKYHEHVRRDRAAALALVERAIAAAGPTVALTRRRARLLARLGG